MDIRTQQIWLGRRNRQMTGNPFLALLFVLLGLVVALPFLILGFLGALVLVVWAHLRRLFPGRATPPPRTAPPGSGPVIDVEVTRSR